MTRKLPDEPMLPTQALAIAECVLQWEAESAAHDRKKHSWWEETTEAAKVLRELRRSLGNSPGN